MAAQAWSGVRHWMPQIWSGFWSASRSRAGEAVQVTLRHAYLPQRFRRRGKLYSVEAIERIWERCTPSPARCYSVRCSDGARATLIHDLRADVWQLRA